MGVLDLFGPKAPAEGSQYLNRLENLCVNLCAETIEYFFKTHAFKNIIEQHKAELNEPIRIEYLDNGPVVDLISSQKSGILAVFDRTVSEKTKPLTNITFSFEDNPGYEASHDGTTFTIEHYSERVTYNVDAIRADLEPKISRDMVSMFSSSNCSFQFASHLFSNELKIVAHTSENESKFRSIENKDIKLKFPLYGFEGGGGVFTWF